MKSLENTAIKYHFPPTRTAVTKNEKKENSKCWQGCEEIRSHTSLVGM